VVGAFIGLANRPLLRAAGGRAARAAGWLAGLAVVGSAAALVADDRAEGFLTQQRTVALARQRWIKDGVLINELEKVRTTYRAVATPRALRRGTAMRPAVRRPRPAPAPSPTSGGAAKPGPAAPAAGSSNPGTANPVRLDPILEFDLTVLNAGLRLLDAMAPDLDSGDSSADYRRARQLLLQTLTEPQPTFDEIREFDDRLASIQQRLRADQDEARRTVEKLSGAE
jgi:hypothetical protein